MIYGDKAEFWRNKVREGVPPMWTTFDGSHDRILCSNQIAVHAAGYREASLTETIFGYSIRLRSGLCENQVLFGGRGQGRDMSYEEALEWGMSWVDASPDFHVLNYSEKCGGCYLDHHKRQEAKI